MFQFIRKRNGQVVPFDARKITSAILKAGQITSEFEEQAARTMTYRVLDVASQAGLPDPPSVEDIQDIVEEILLGSPYKRAAKSYILYRDQHAKIREIVSRADVDLIDHYLEKLDWQVKENSNMAYSLQGLNNYISSEVSKTYWLNKIYPPEIRRAHSEGDFHLHDLGILSVYCVGWDLQDLLREGFRGAPGKVESGPPRHFRSALGQIVNFFYTLQGEAAGAQAFSNFDTLLAPFIRFDDLTYAEVKQALQEFVFNLNVPTRVGFQTPFTNLTLDLEVPESLRNQPITFGGKMHESAVYGDFQKEVYLLNQAFLEVMAEGDALGRVFTFPIPTYNITPDFDWDHPALETLWQATARYGIPYFSNFVNSDLSPDDARSMCCRLRLDLRHLEHRGGGLFGASPLTGSIGVVTINLPRLAYLAQTDAEFFSKLEDLMELAKQSLEIKRKILEQLTDIGLYPYSQFYLRGVRERFGTYWKNHFSTIGLVGMHEACLNRFGKGIDTQRGQEFARDVLDFMRERLVAFQEETGHHFNLEATPAEGTSHRLARLDRQKFADIVCAGDSGETVFYTNSTQLPVNFTEDLFEALDIQDELQSRYTGGTVMHLFVGEEITDTAALKALIRKICHTYRLPYFTITPTFSICPTHGYLAGEQASCPHCGKATEVYSRVVGYLRPVSQWNDGKAMEFRMRRTFHVAGHEEKK